jgi:glucose-6-phosphate isomerase
MIRLSRSGLPIDIDESSGELVLEKSLAMLGSGIKYSKDMKALLYDGSYNVEEPFYSFYRGVNYPGDNPVFEKYDLRYDITVVMPGTAGKECKKTSGHYHGLIPGKATSYPEIYEVVKGKAIYILQKVKDMDAADDKTAIEDLIIAEVDEGQTIIIPPLYGHCSINAGEGCLVFTNLVADKSPNYYESVLAHRGLAYYIIKENGGLGFLENRTYENVPRPRFARVQECRELGICDGIPVYKAFISSPEKFAYLTDPGEFMDRIKSNLIFR